MRAIVHPEPCDTHRNSTARVRHIHRGVRAGKTVKSRRRRATVRRRSAVRATVPSRRDGKAARFCAAKPGDRRTSQPRKPETIPDTRTTFNSRAKPGEGAPVKTFVRLLSFLSPFVLLISFGTLHDVSTQAQTPATLTGILTDPHGASVAGAEVRVESIPAAGAAAQAKSETDGRFSLTLGPGRYRVTITRESFARVEQDVTLAAGEARELRIQLSLEPLSASVLVTAQAIPLDASSAPGPVDILTRADIDRRGAASLPDLLATRPGFILGRTGPEGGSTSLFLDGGNSNYTKVLVDGAPANEPGGLIDFSNFTLDNIEKIEVVHGAESALYGSDAMDGVIQIFTRRGSTRTPAFAAFAEGGNFSTGRGGADLSGLLGRFDYSGAFSDLETVGQGRTTLSEIERSPATSAGAFRARRV